MKIKCSICNSNHTETMVRITEKKNPNKLYAHKSCLTESDLDPLHRIGQMQRDLEEKIKETERQEVKKRMREKMKQIAALAESIYNSDEIPTTKSDPKAMKNELSFYA